MIDMSSIFMTVMLCIVLAISTFSAIADISILRDTATEITRYIETRGAFDDTAKDELNRLNTVTGLETKVQVQTNFIYGNKIQLNEPFTVVLKANTFIGVGGIFKIPIEISSKKTGRSERLWK